MSDEVRLDLYVQLKGLSSPPYNEPTYWADLVLWHAELTDKLASVHTAASPKVNATFKHPNSSTSKREAIIFDDQSPQSVRGRPKNETCEVEVIIYVEVSSHPSVVSTHNDQCMQNAHEPHRITAQGTLRDGLVEFTMAQLAVDKYLAELRDPKAHPMPFEFLRWHPNIDNWSLYPKRSHVSWLVPGERVLYRELAVFDMPSLDAWKAYATAATPRLSSVLSSHSLALTQPVAGAKTRNRSKRERSFDGPQQNAKRVATAHVQAGVSAGATVRNHKGHEGASCIDLTLDDSD